MTDVFTDSQTRYLLDAIGVSVVDETPTHWLCLCPFHGNLNTPAMVVDKEAGVFLCNNAACDARGVIRQMIQTLTGKSYIQTEFLILKAQRDSKFDTLDFVKRQLEPEEFPKYPMDKVLSNHEDFWKHKDAVKYMTETRHFERRTLEEFQIGYIYDDKSKVELVTVPMFDQEGSPVGFIGRGIYDKVFKNSVKLPKRHTLFNVHRAKKSPTTFVTEASFDTMRGWQATGIHGVATLGSYIGQGQADQMDRYFSTVINATDDDKKREYKKHCNRCRSRGESECIGHNTGFELGMTISETIGARTLWAHLDSLKRYDGGKDFGDLTDEQIKYSIDNAISNYEMLRRKA